MNIPGFTAEVSLPKQQKSFRVAANDNRNNSDKVIPQMSCWRVCYDISSTNHELSECYRSCSAVKRIFNL